ncbi:MAG: hypothetical protein ACR2NR_05335 [Solirubrobacteraceae bacterium]
MWFGVMGGGTAFAIQFVAGLAFTFAQCGRSGRTDVPVQSWQTALSAAGVLVGLTAMGTALRLYRASAVGDIPAHLREGDDAPPPIGRIHFLATVGLLVNLLAVTIMIMTAVGAPLLQQCQQS